ncbi:MAG: ROK family protein [Candidatus Brocadiales bacterium]
MTMTKKLSNKLILGADAGGTNIKTVLVNSRGKVFAAMKRPTLARRGRDAVIERLVLTLRDTVKKSGVTMRDVAGAGIGFAGPLDAGTGIVFNPPNLPGWSNVPLRDILKQRLKMPVALDNDANLVAMGEYWKGAGRGAKCLICLTLGTGVGGGIILGGRVWHGASGIAGEIGHMTVVRNGRRCACGNKGCLEAYASSNGMVLRMQELLKTGNVRRHDKVTPKNIERWALSGDKLATKAIKDTGVILGVAIASIANMLNPDVVVIGGGVSKIGDPLFDPIREEVEKRAFTQAVEGLKIVKAELGDNAGAIGAAKALMLSLNA